MSTPLEILLDPVTLTVIAIFGTLFTWETLFPARKLPKVKFWFPRGFIFFLAYILLTTYIPMFWDEFLASYQLFNLAEYSLPLQIAIGVLIVEIVQYIWHISMHKVDFMFRISHQLHHSAERLDVPSAFMFSLNDIIGLSLVGSLSFALILGLTPQAITLIIYILTFLGVFQHANINTPRWLGYIIQRPESHTLHHAKGIHAYNYSDLPIIDIIFGTFKNPKTYEYETGYYAGASNRIPEMLIGKDVTVPK